MSDIKRSGDGTRPTTSGTIDNIGAGESFVPGKDTGGPAPKENMSDKRSDAAATKVDDSVPLGLHADVATKKH